MHVRSQLSWGVSPRRTREWAPQYPSDVPPSYQQFEGELDLAPARFAGIEAPDRYGSRWSRSVSRHEVHRSRGARVGIQSHGAPRRSPDSVGKFPDPGLTCHCSRRARGSIVVERAVAIATTARVSPRRYVRPQLNEALGGHTVRSVAVRHCPPSHLTYYRVLSCRDSASSPSCWLWFCPAPACTPSRTSWCTGRCELPTRVRRYASRG